MSLNLTYQTNKNIEADQLKKLYAAVGWTTYIQAFDQLLLGIQQSLDLISVYLDKELIGLVRTVGDGQTIVYIQDLIVCPAHQNKGIGGILVQKIVQKYTHVRQLVLMTNHQEHLIHFYKKQGFHPTTDLGCINFIYQK